MSWARTSIGALLLIAAGGTAASGYVRSSTSTGTALEWRGICTDLRLHAAENPALPHVLLRPAVQRAVDNWASRLVGCTSLELAFVGEPSGRADVHYDSTNSVLWRLPGFCDEPAHATKDVCLSPNAAAITTVFYIDNPGAGNDGEIVEVDIVINGTHHEFSAGETPDALDLESVMTHELGHFLGLGHTCHTDRGDAPPVDDDGEVVPFCFPTTDLDDRVTGATMYNYIGPGETDKRVPDDDEWSGLCEIYADHPGTCTHDHPGCGCDAGAEHGAETLVVLIAIVLVVLRTRRRRPR